MIPARDARLQGLELSSRASIDVISVATVWLLVYLCRDPNLLVLLALCCVVEL